MTLRARLFVVALAGSLSALMPLAACGGGGGNPPATTPQQPEHPFDTGGVDDNADANRLPFPLAGFSCVDHYGEGTDCDAYTRDTFAPDNIPTYNIDALPQRASDDDGRHMPVYHDHSQLFGIGVHDWGDHPRRIFVGTDRGESVGRIPTAGERGATKLRHGTVADGVASAELRAYLTESLGAAAHRWKTAPTVRISDQADAKQRNWIVAAVELVNAALPTDAKMTVGGTSSHIVTIEFRPYTEFAEDTGATTWNQITDNEIVSSRIHVSEGAFSGLSHRHFVTLIAHELMHAMGLGHVSPDFDTLMESSTQIYRAWQGLGAGGHIQDANDNFVPRHENLADIPLPMSLVYPVDREALQILYTKLKPGDAPTSFGYWAGASLHIAGNGPHANFGVALRNGYAEPWAHGYMPEIDLTDNAALVGAATWGGTLLGFTPDAAAVAGDAEIGVTLATLTGRADFTSLETWAAGATPGDAGTGTMWGDGDLGYTITVRGNGFRETGGDDGRLTGIFVGRAHEGAAGTLGRADLTAAFGATRP